MPSTISGFRLGSGSLRRLKGVRPELIAVIVAALRRSTTDFSVVEGGRTIARQTRLVAQRKSKTLNSRHLSGCAVDVVPWIDGRNDWDRIGNFVEIADAFRLTAIDLGYPLRWGAAWTCPDLREAASAYEAMQAYISERQSHGRQPFIDAIHFELPVGWEERAGV